MGESEHRPRLHPAAYWTGCLLLVAVALGLPSPGPGRDRAGAETVIVARSGVLEQAWEAEFHLGWPEPGRARAQLTAAVPLGRAQRLKTGQSVAVRLDTGAGEQQILAKVVEVSAPVDGVAHAVFTTAETYVLSDAPSRLPGRLVTGTGPYGTIIPVSVLHRSDGAEGVFVERHDGPAWVPVRVVSRTLTEALVEGVAPGTRIVPAAAAP